MVAIVSALIALADVIVFDLRIVLS